MSDEGDIIISVKAKYVERILSGEKTIELRRRSINIAPGSRIWIYSKLPGGCIGAFATVDRVLTAHPSKLWRRYNRRLGVTLNEFKKYFSGVGVACGIVLRDVQEISPALHLGELRKKCAPFHPPQFFKRLREGSLALQLLRSRALRPRQARRCGFVRI